MEGTALLNPDLLGRHLSGSTHPPPGGVMPFQTDRHSATRQPNSAGGAQSDDLAQESEPAGTILRGTRPTREKTRWNHVLELPGPGLSASVASLTLSHGTHTVPFRSFLEIGFVWLSFAR